MFHGLIFACYQQLSTPLPALRKIPVGTSGPVSLLAPASALCSFDRTRRKDTARTNGAVAERLQAGDAIVLLPRALQAMARECCPSAPHCRAQRGIRHRKSAKQS